MMKFIQKDIILYLILLILGLGGIVSALLWPTTEGFYVSMILSAIGGLGVTFYIFYAKHFLKSLACPSGSDCNSVVNSKYGKFFGIPLECLGMTYYALVVVSYLSLLMLPSLKDSVILPAILILTASAFLFSLYLLSVQAFILKKWCIWCLLSASLSILIFIASLSSLSAAELFLIQMHPVLMLFKSFGYVLGMGGATASVIVFFRFLDDFQINDNEARALKGLSELVWFGLGLVLISKLAYFISNPKLLATSDLFVTQVIILIIIFITGAVLNVIFSPFVSVLPFHEKNKKTAESLSKLRLGTLITGSISLFSWYFVFLSNHLIFENSAVLFFAYLLTLVLATITALALNQKLS